MFSFHMVSLLQRLVSAHIETYEKVWFSSTCPVYCLFQTGSGVSIAGHNHFKITQLPMLQLMWWLQCTGDKHQWQCHHRLYQDI